MRDLICQSPFSRVKRVLKHVVLRQGVFDEGSTLKLQLPSMSDENSVADAELIEEDQKFNISSLLLNPENSPDGGTINKGSAGKDEPKYTEITKEKPIRLQVKVLIPVKEHPRFNFVGKLLGPKGNSLKRLQEETLTKMAILGRGSMRDKNKEEELRKQNDPKHAHLNEELHVEVNTFAPPADAYSRIGHALTEIKKFLVPDDNDEIRQTQLQELAYINGNAPPSGTALGRGRGRGAAPPPPIGGPPPARTVRAGLLATPPPGVSAVAPPPSRAAIASARGAAARAPLPLPRVATYRPTVVTDLRTPGEEAYTFEDEYEYPPETYEQRYEEENSEAQFYEYAHGASVEAYDGEYAAGEAYTAEEWRPPAGENRLKARTNSTRGTFREHPYPPPQAPRY